MNINGFSFRLLNGKHRIKPLAEKSASQAQKCLIQAQISVTALGPSR